MPGNAAAAYEPAQGCFWQTENETLSDRIEAWNHTHDVVHPNISPPLVLVVLIVAAHFNMWTYLKTVADLVWSAINTDQRKAIFLSRMVRWYERLKTCTRAQVQAMIHTPTAQVVHGDNRPRCTALKADGSALCSRYTCRIPQANQHGFMCWQHRYQGYNRAGGSMRCDEPLA